MQLTIIVSDKFVSIDKVGYFDVDMSTISSNVSAVQWYETQGEIEIKDSSGKIIENRPIISIDEFQPIIDSWTQQKLKAQQELKAIQEKAQQELQAASA